MSLTANDIRQMLRIATGATLGFSLSKLFNWPNGIFFTVYPMLLLGLVPIINAHIVRQFIASALFCGFAVLVLQGLFGFHPILMSILAFAMFAFLFYQMSRGAHFLFGAMSVVGLSIQLHFASYSATGLGLYPLIFSNFLAVTVSLASAYIMHWLFPDVSARTPISRAAKDAASVRHEVLLCATVATLSFMVFQILDLQDSVSAQAASILILFPLCWKAASMAGWQRAIGTLIGCNLALAAQLLLFTYSQILVFPILVLWILTFVFSRYHVLGGGMPGVGFGVITTFGILFGQSLAPNQDLVYSALYRFSSVCVAITASLCLVYVIHHILNRFAATRHHTFT
ncbi:permease of the major facilitator superfamily [Pseudoalteromonas sp. SW0106-04]|uniref:DUF2955 domain-containing protein n=1 Tax=Pseudoalteromonas TaxID=53246 RepID=UPI0006B4F6AE|nr:MULTISPECIES: DUF2955 domain-containing protein [Pseudoalteromonas]GAP73740.1 permease of the major facilitator superfamily [Pseudoalteromonas sp. SW0106-04]|tara:strand:- start:53249 stop:54274 length:1026 start_codon:yes stop_codon:yes gene_type:complete